MHSACENRPRGAKPGPICTPSFVTPGRDAHYIARVGILLGGEHMHVWKQADARRAALRRYTRRVRAELSELGYNVDHGRANQCA